MTPAQNRHHKWWICDRIPTFLQFCFKCIRSSWPVFMFWCRQVFPCCIYVYEEYTPLFCVAVWKLQQPLFQTGSSSTEQCFPGSPVKPSSLVSATSFFHFVHVYVFLLFLLTTSGKCIIFWVCQKHKVQFIFERIFSSALVFQVAPPFLSVAWYHLGSNNFSFGRINIKKTKETT